MVRLRIVIVNFRTPGLVVDCLRSLAAEMPSLGDCKVVVVENASGDDSLQRLGDAIGTEGWSSWAQLIAAEKNLGFAGGNNVAIRPILQESPPADYLVLLNPDTVIRPGAMKNLVDFMEKNPKIGIAGSRLEDPDGTGQRSAFRFPTFTSELEGGMRLGLMSKLLKNSLVAPPVRTEEHPTDWVAGASMIVRKAVFDAIGLMDEGYFLYFEETDFCLRAARAGWPCWYVPSSRVVHLVGQSSGVTDVKKPAKRLPQYWFDSYKRYYRKNHGAFYAYMTSLAWAFGHLTYRVRRVVQRKPDTDPPHLFRDFVRNNLLLLSPAPRAKP